MQIPEFSRRRLASSVVGTAGVDTSGQQIANSIAQSAGQIADVSGRIAVARAEAKDKAVSFDTSLSYEADLQKLELEHQKEYATFDGDPITRAEVFREKAAAMRDTYAQGMPSDRARTEFLQSSGSALNSSFKSELKTASKNQVAIGAERTVATANKLSNTAYGLFSNPEISLSNKLYTLNQLESKRVQNVNNSVALLGVEEAGKLDKSSKEGLTEAAIRGLMENSPTDAVKFLKEKGVKEALGAKVYDEWVGKAQKRALDFKDIIKERQFKQVMQTNLSDIEKFQNGEHNLASIAAIKDETTKKFLQNAYLDTKQLSAGEIFDVQADYVNQFESLFVRDKKTGVVTTELKKDTKFEDIVKLQQLAMSNFKVTQSNSSLIGLSKKLPDMIAQSVENGQPSALLKVWANASKAFEVVAKAIATGRIENKSELKHVTAGEKAEMADIFFNKLSNVNVEDPVAVQNAIKSTIEAHQSKKNPNRAKYLIGDSVATPRGAGEVIGYSDDGEPLLRFKQ